MGKFIEMTGKHFGKLTVIEYAGRLGARPVSAWKCRCECGNEKVIRGADLQRGKTVSCGCFMKQQIRIALLKHGESSCTSQATKEYQAWLAIKRRVNIPDSQDWPNYGGRGITMSKEWEHSFLAFLADMGRAPTSKHSVDRINTNGNYEKSNCKWSTNKQQTNNKRNNVRLTYNGKTQTATQWGEELGIPSNTIRLRHRKGLSIDQVFSRERLR